MLIGASPSFVAVSCPVDNGKAALVAYTGALMFAKMKTTTNGGAMYIQFFSMKVFLSA